MKSLKVSGIAAGDSTNFRSAMGTAVGIVSAVLSWALLGIIWMYRLTFSPIIGQYCRFQPTCSRYAEEVIRKYGPLRGVYLAANRLRKCHPWGPFGPDPAP